MITLSAFYWKSQIPSISTLIIPTNQFPIRPDSTSKRWVGKITSFSTSPTTSYTLQFHHPYSFQDFGVSNPDRQYDLVIGVREALVGEVAHTGYTSDVTHIFTDAWLVWVWGIGRFYLGWGLRGQLIEELRRPAIVWGGFGLVCLFLHELHRF